MFKALLKGGGLFSLAKKMLSNLHKELECKVEKLMYKKLEVMQPMIQNKSECPVWISPHEVLLLLLIKTVYYLLVNDTKGEGGGLKKEMALINYLLLKREDLLERGGNSLRREEGV